MTLHRVEGKNLNFSRNYTIPKVTAEAVVVPSFVSNRRIIDLTSVAGEALVANTQRRVAVAVSTVRTFHVCMCVSVGCCFVEPCRTLCHSQQKQCQG